MSESLKKLAIVTSGVAGATMLVWLIASGFALLHKENFPLLAATLTCVTTLSGVGINYLLRPDPLAAERFKQHRDATTTAYNALCSHLPRVMRWKMTERENQRNLLVRDIIVDHQKTLVTLATIELQLPKEIVDACNVVLSGCVHLVKDGVEFDLDKANSDFKAKCRKYTSLEQAA